MSKQRRFGVFRIPAQWVQEMRPEVTRIMGMCAVYRAEHLLMSDQVEYVVECWKFRPVPPGEIAPGYAWSFSEDGSVDCHETTSQAEVRGIFAPPDEHKPIKAYAAKLAKKRKEQK